MSFCRAVAPGLDHAPLRNYRASAQASKRSNLFLSRARFFSCLFPSLSLSTFSRAFQSNVGIAGFLQASGRNCASWIDFLALNLHLLLSLPAVVVALQIMSVGTCGRWTIWASTAVGRGELSEWFQIVEEQLITDFLGSWVKKKKLVQFFVNIIQLFVSPCAAGCCCGSVYFFTAAFWFLYLFLSFPCRCGEESL